MIKKKDIDEGKPFDWGKTSVDYAKYRDIYPKEFFQKIADLGLCVKGQKVLDLGTGTGVLPRNMYKYGASFVGADISQNQIEQAKRLSEEQRMDIEYIVSPSETINFPDNTFDVVTACQCFMYFDKEALLPNVARLLKHNGQFAIMFFSWLSYESDIAKKSEDLILKYNPSWTGFGMRRHAVESPEWAKDLFITKHRIAFDISVPFTRESWNGRIRACRGVGASLPEDRIKEFDHEHMEMLKKIAPESFEILHYATVLVLQVKN
jgi:SAM-dependent methyltransferase